MLGELDPAAPDILPYDFSHQANPDAGDEQNRGCPVGYFAQYVGPGEPDAAPSGNPAAWIRCRKVASSTAQTIQDESAITAQEQLDIYRKAIEDTVRQFGAGLPSFGRGLVVGLVAIAVILVAWKR